MYKILIIIMFFVLLWSITYAEAVTVTLAFDYPIQKESEITRFEVQRSVDASTYVKLKTVKRTLRVTTVSVPRNSLVYCYQILAEKVRKGGNTISTPSNSVCIVKHKGQL